MKKMRAINKVEKDIITNLVSRKDGTVLYDLLLDFVSLETITDYVNKSFHENLTDSSHEISDQLLEKNKVHILNAITF